MKCPKCGFNSFDHLEECRKCGQDLNAHKARFGLRSVLFPGGGMLVAESSPSRKDPAEVEPPADAGADTGEDWQWGEAPEEASLSDLLGDSPAADAGRKKPARKKTPGILQSSLFDATDDRPDAPVAADNEGSLPETVATGGSRHQELFEAAVHTGADEALLFWGEGPEAEEAADTGWMTPAPVPFHRRFAAGVIDLVLLSLGFLLFVMAAETILSDGKGGSFPSPAALIDLAIPYFLVLFTLCFGYFTLFHFLLGQTPGKMLLSLRVESEEGDDLSFAQAFLRSVGGLISLLPAGFGFVAARLAADGRGWNDRLAGTRVVPAFMPWPRDAGNDLGEAGADDF